LRLARNAAVSMGGCFLSLTSGYFAAMILNRSPWRPPPDDLRLPKNEVHVWRATLERAPESVAQLHSILSPDERERARRFYFDRHRRRWVVGRASLRMLLGRYLGAGPASLSFGYGQFGKPYLAGFETPLRFNVSHSGEIVLMALTLGRAVGVDIERIRPDLLVAQIAQRFFSASESRALATLPEQLQQEAFFRCWTRKEAYIKARGGGLSLPLDAFDVAFLPGEPAKLLATRPDPAEASRWHIKDLDVGEGYKAALAVEGSQSTLEWWNWRT
jgi:4'-phosphopantetheinyl transferase